MTFETRFSVGCHPWRFLFITFLYQRSRNAYRYLIGFKPEDKQMTLLSSLIFIQLFSNQSDNKDNYLQVILRLNSYLNHRKDRSITCVIVNFSIFHQVEISMNILKTRGPKTKPWGTSRMVCFEVLNEPLTFLL